MRNQGFSILEVILSIALLSLLFIISYSIYLSVEQINHENIVLSQINQSFDQEIEEWRKGIEKTDRSFTILDSTIMVEVQYVSNNEMIDYAIFTYRWNIGKKKYQKSLDVERFHP